MACAFGAGQGGSQRLLQPAHVNQSHACACLPHEHEQPSVRGEDHRGARVAGRSWQGDVRSELHAQAQRRRRQRRTPPGRPGHERQREGERPRHHPRQCRSLLRRCRFALAADEARRIRVRDRVLDRDACLADVAQPASGIPFRQRRTSCRSAGGVAGGRASQEIPGARRPPARRSRSPREQPLARQHLVQHDAEGPDVRTLVDRPAARLLRAHVGRGAEDDSRGAQCRDSVGETSPGRCRWRSPDRCRRPWPGRNRGSSRRRRESS